MNSQIFLKAFERFSMFQRSLVVALCLHFGALGGYVYRDFFKEKPDYKAKFGAGANLSTMRVELDTVAIRNLVKSKPNTNAASVGVTVPTKYFSLKQVDSPPSLSQSAGLAGYLAEFYPSQKRLAGVEAVVRVEIFLNVDGKVAEAHVVKSAGAEFDSAALKIASILEFNPASVAGKAVAIRFILPIPFRLK